jgi:hypothetical protein
MGIAVLALKVSEVFLDPARATLDDAALGRELVAAAREFDRGAGA